MEVTPIVCKRCDNISVIKGPFEDGHLAYCPVCRILTTGYVLKTVICLNTNESHYEISRPLTE